MKNIISTTAVFKAHPFLCNSLVFEISTEKGHGLSHPFQRAKLLHFCDIPTLFDGSPFLAFALEEMAA
jgi:hypothetical protein